MEGHDGVGGVTEHDRLVAVAPTVDVKGAERAGRIVCELVGEVGHERSEVGELVGEERLDRVGVDEVGEDSLRCEEGHGEVACGVGERDQHQLAPWPDVQRMGIEAVRTVSIRREGQLLVVVVEPFGTRGGRAGHFDRLAHR